MYISMQSRYAQTTQLHKYIYVYPTLNTMCRKFLNVYENSLSEYNILSV